MTIITREHGMFNGRSDDGRITYAAGNSGPRIDGRLAWRRYYVDETSGRVTDEPVPDADWEKACEVMHVVDDRQFDQHEARIKEQDERLGAREDAMLEAGMSTRGTGVGAGENEDRAEWTWGKR